MIKSYKLFESYNDIKSTCDDYNIHNWSINPETGLVDVRANVIIRYTSIKRLPINFGEITGDFVCNGNELTTLEGAPTSVSGDFKCSNNGLTSLKGAPSIIGQYFECDCNKLTSLEHGPISVGGYYSCEKNNITTLEGMPKKLTNNFYCRENNIRDFYGVPEEVFTDNAIGFYCLYNPVYEIISW